MALIHMGQGAPLMEQRDRVGYVCQRYIFPKPSDIGKTVEKISNNFSNRFSNADFFTWAIHPSDVIRPVTSHADRWGQVIAIGRDPEEARTRADQAVSEMYAGVVLE